MCDICKRTLCPRGCPNYGRAAGEPTCAECGAVIPRGEEYYRFGEVAVCAECADGLDLDGLARRAGLDGREDVFLLVGAERARAS